MGYIKTFSEFIKESFSSVGKLADSIYTVLDKEYSGNFYEPDIDADSACLNAELDSFNLEYNGDLFEIGFDEDCLFNTDDIVFYQIFVADNAPIDPKNDVTSSLWIEFGEKGYAEGPETWCLYYDAENDSWESTGADDAIRDSRIIEVVTRITSLVNPHTKYVPGYDPSAEGYSDSGETLEDLYNYLLDNYENLGKEDIVLNKGEDSDGIWYELSIPVTLSGLNLETEPYVGRPGETFSVDIKPELEKYLEPGTYDEIDDDILDEHGVLRVFTEIDEVSNEGLLKLLDGILKNVPDPALRRK